MLIEAIPKDLSKPWEDPLAGAALPHWWMLWRFQFCTVATALACLPSRSHTGSSLTRTLDHAPLAADASERALAQELRGIGMGVQEVPEWKQQVMRNACSLRCRGRGLFMSWGVGRACSLSPQALFFCHVLVLRAHSCVLPAYLACLR